MGKRAKNGDKKWDLENLVSKEPLCWFLTPWSSGAGMWVGGELRCRGEEERGEQLSSILSALSLPRPTWLRAETQQAHHISGMLAWGVGLIGCCLWGVWENLTAGMGWGWDGVEMGWDWGGMEWGQR